MQASASTSRAARTAAAARREVPAEIDPENMYVLKEINFSPMKIAADKLASEMGVPGPKGKDMSNFKEWWAVSCLPGCLVAWPAALGCCLPWAAACLGLLPNPCSLSGLPGCSGTPPTAWAPSSWWTWATRPSVVAP